MWQDGYWTGRLKDGYPESYFDDEGRFSFPWEKDLPPIKKFEKSAVDLVLELNSDSESE